MNNNGVFLSKKAINAKGDWSAIKEKENNGEPVEVKITEYVNTEKVKGYRGKVGEIEAFIPETHIDIHLKNIYGGRKVNVIPRECYSEIYVKYTDLSKINRELIHFHKSLKKSILYDNENISFSFPSSVFI